MEGIKTQCDVILDILESGGTITQHQAMNELGIMRLASRVNDLKKMGYDVRSRRVKAPTRYGCKSTPVCEYYLAEEGE